jgi:hypothetical protein
VDLADGRDFVCGIDVLDPQAKAAGVLLLSGASRCLRCPRRSWMRWLRPWLASAVST